MTPVNFFLVRPSPVSALGLYVDKNLILYKYSWAFIRDLLWSHGQRGLVVPACICVYTNDKSTVASPPLPRLLSFILLQTTRGDPI